MPIDSTSTVCAAISILSPWARLKSVMVSVARKASTHGPWTLLFSPVVGGGRGPIVVPSALTCLGDDCRPWRSPALEAKVVGAAAAGEHIVYGLEAPSVSSEKIWVASVLAATVSPSVRAAQQGVVAASPFM